MSKIEIGSRLYAYFYNPVIDAVDRYVYFVHGADDETVTISIGTDMIRIRKDEVNMYDVEFPVFTSAMFAYSNALVQATRLSQMMENDLEKIEAAKIKIKEYMTREARHQ